MGPGEDEEGGWNVVENTDCNLLKNTLFRSVSESIIYVKMKDRIQNYRNIVFS